MITPGALPELLAPAGSLAALQAAIEGGADAVYFGGANFNARMRAENFGEGFRDAVALCHAYGVRAYITLNTLVTDRELPAFLAAAEQAVLAGADALIVADLGGAAAIRRAFPSLALHASTQVSGHNADAARELAAMGFCRMVLARETCAEDVRRFLCESGMETEIFVHGALCVSHSGQCLFSSLVGGRSGNRGACAQPCRLPDAHGDYPLSLKDLCLARHVPALIDMRVDSLKIEGRLKSPEYVRDVTRIWRRLLDERRAATDAEMAELTAVFSHGGLTDGYFRAVPAAENRGRAAMGETLLPDGMIKEKLQMGQEMRGVRSERDKENSRAAAPFAGITRRVPLDLVFTMRRDAPMTLSLTANGKTVSVTGDIPLLARSAPMDAAAVRKNLCRFGDTPYTTRDVKLELDEGLMVPVSRLNALRRAGLVALAERNIPQNGVSCVPVRAPGERNAEPTARFAHAGQITPAARAFFSRVYLPLERYAPVAQGVVLPPVIFDSERDTVRALLEKARERGARDALVGNLGHLALAREFDLVPHGDFRLNVTNEETVAALLARGFQNVLLSPELTLAQIRDIGGATEVIVYGRVPLMLLENCVGHTVGSCDACATDRNVFVDRLGEKFPVLRAFSHRSVLLNSRPIVMSDRRAALIGAGVRAGHFLFTVESPDAVDAVLAATRDGTPLAGNYRRIPK